MIAKASLSVVCIVLLVLVASQSQEPPAKTATSFILTLHDKNTAESSLGVLKRVQQQLSPAYSTKHIGPSSLVIDTQKPYSLKRLKEKLGFNELDYSLSINAKVKLASTPTDDHFAKQWYMKAFQYEKNIKDRKGRPIDDEYIESRIDAEGAWQYSKGSPNVYVAVVDSGVVMKHPDLKNQMLAGYDFIKGAILSETGKIDSDANDSLYGRDNDASDPGTYGQDCNGVSIRSNWHGTKVSSIIAAEENDYGIVGVAPRSKIVPVRFIGKCDQGSLGDLIASFNWLAGKSVEGIPAHNFQDKLRVVNASVGGDGRCPAELQSAINALHQKNISVVVAAGNERQDSVRTYPANCQNVISVSAVNLQGHLTRYSNHGASIDISAPGGDKRTIYYESVNGMEQRNMYVAGINNPYIFDPQNPQYWIDAEEGTSFSAPLVSGVLALMYSVNPDLSNLEAETILKANTSPYARNYKVKGVFAKGACRLNSLTRCGLGNLNAHKAVEAVHLKKQYDAENGNAPFMVLNNLELNWFDHKPDGTNKVKLEWSFAATEQLKRVYLDALYTPANIHQNVMTTYYEPGFNEINEFTLELGECYCQSGVNFRFEFSPVSRFAKQTMNVSMPLCQYEAPSSCKIPEDGIYSLSASNDYNEAGSGGNNPVNIDEKNSVDLGGGASSMGVEAVLLVVLGWIFVRGRGYASMPKIPVITFCKNTYRSLCLLLVCLLYRR